MKLIDFHTHIYPQAIAQKATKSVEDFYSLEAKSQGTAEELIRVSKLAGVTANVVLPVAIKPSGVQHINDFALSVQNEYDQIYSFGTVHAGMESIEEEVQRIISMGLHGIKIHPDTQQFDIDDKRMYPVYSIIEGRFPLVVHCGDPRYDYSHPRKVRKIMKDFPKLVTVAAHLGGWESTSEGEKYLPDLENCYVDISSSFYYLPFERAQELVKLYGEDRVLFASDFPLGSPVIEKENFLRLDISDKAREKIAYKNAEKLLNIKI